MSSRFAPLGKLWRSTQIGCCLLVAASCVLVLAARRASDPALWLFSTVAVLEMLFANIRRAFALWTHDTDPFVELAAAIRRRFDEEDRRKER